MTTPALQKIDTSMFQCQPGCSVAEHRHGASSSGHGGGGAGAGGSTVGTVQQQLLQNAQDQDDGDAHLGKLIAWYEQVEADLDRLLEDTHLPDLAEVRQTIDAQIERLNTTRELLAQSAQATRDIEARL